MKALINNVLHIIRISGANLLQFVGRLHPLESNTVVLYAYNRKGLCCNPKYILKAFLKYYPGEYKLYWVSKWPETVEQGDGYEVIKLRSMRFYLICSRAKFLITNDMMDETLHKRKGQIYINTWHGGGLFKKAGYDMARTPDEEAIIRRNYENQDFMIVSNVKLKALFKEAFRMNEEQLLSCGMPRSDVFFGHGVLYEDIRKYFNLPLDTMIVLYAPTFREKRNEKQYFPEKKIKLLLERLSSKFGGDWVFFYKMHYFEGGFHYGVKRGEIYNCEKYYDTQELLCGVDVLITDYSSLLWDFTLLGRPSFRYAPDTETYEDSERKFYLDYDKWPYPYAKDVDELLEQIDNYDEEYYKTRMDEFITYVGSFDDGNSSKNFVQWLHKQ